MDRNHTRRIELTLTGLLLAAILSAGAAYGQVQTKYRDRINLPGVRITREYVDTGEAKTQPVPSPAKSKQGTRRARTGSIPVSPTGNAPMANPDSPTGQPLQIKQLSLDWVDRLIAACNRRGIHDLQYNGEFIEYKDGTPGPVLPARVVVGGWEGCRADLGDVDGDGSRWLMNRWEAWVIRSGQASQSGRQLYPEFHPFLPAVTMAWAFSAMRSDGRLKLLDQGTAILAGQPCRVVEAVHEGCTTDYSPAARLASSEPERHYRLYLDNKDRLVRLDYRGFTYLYGNYIKFLNSGLVLATTVRCYSQGIHRWDHQIDSQSLQEIDRPDPAIFSPESDRQKGLLVMKEDDFSAEKIWNENRPDVMGGDAPFGTFHGDSVVSVNIQNQNLNISIPFVDYPQRGALGLPMGLTYNSKLWDIQCSGSESDFGSTKAPGHGKK